MDAEIDWGKAGQMLANGSNFAEIARELGTSRQTVHYHYVHARGKRANTVIAYSALRKWRSENNMSYMKIGELLYPNARSKSSASQNARNIFVGKTKVISIDAVIRLAEITGLSVQEMFRKE